MDRLFVTLMSVLVVSTFFSGYHSAMFLYYLRFALVVWSIMDVDRTVVILIGGCINRLYNW